MFLFKNRTIEKDKVRGREQKKQKVCLREIGSKQLKGYSHYIKIGFHRKKNTQHRHSTVEPFLILAIMLETALERKDWIKKLCLYNLLTFFSFCHFLLP